MGRKVVIKVVVELPSNIDREDIRQYVEDAVMAWCKSFEPPNATENYSTGDPLFYINDCILEVK